MILKMFFFHFSCFRDHDLAIEALNPPWIPTQAAPPQIMSGWQWVPWVRIKPTGQSRTSLMIESLSISMDSFT